MYHWYRLLVDKVQSRRLERDPVSRCEYRFIARNDPPPASTLSEEDRKRFALYGLIEAIPLVVAVLIAVTVSKWPGGIAAILVGLAGTLLISWMLASRGLEFPIHLSNDTDG